MPRASTEQLDAILTTQLVVALAGEWGDAFDQPPVKLGWWKTDLVSDLGGHDLLRRLTPDTWRWQALRAARLAARRTETQALQNALGDATRAVALFRLGAELDESLDDRLDELTWSGQSPSEALVDLAPWLISDDPADFDVEAFEAWLHNRFDAVAFDESTAGRELRGLPGPPRGRANAFARALIPLPARGGRYPSPWARATT